MLTAFKEVEDNLAALRILALEARTQDAAVAAARRLLALANNRYQGGVTTYLEVVVAQNAALNAERTALGIRSRRLAATILLIKALGGGWDVSRLPAISGVGAGLARSHQSSAATNWRTATADPASFRCSPSSVSTFVCRSAGGVCGEPLQERAAGVDVGGVNGPGDRPVDPPVFVEHEVLRVLSVRRLAEERRPAHDDVRTAVDEPPHHVPQGGADRRCAGRPRPTSTGGTHRHRSHRCPSTAPRPPAAAR